jgi:hypothetical protein
VAEQWRVRSLPPEWPLPWGALQQDLVDRAVRGSIAEVLLATG